MMKLAFLVGLGGFAGSSARFLIQKYMSEVVQSSFPLSTFLVNLAGSFIIGALYGFSNKYNIMSAEVRLFLTTGFCGGFTTFSTFSNESLMLLRGENYLYLALYIGLSVLGGIFLTFLGYSIFK